MRFEVIDNGCVGDVLASVCRDVIIVDCMEGVGPINSFANFLGPYTNALAQAAHLVVVRSGPDGRNAWVLVELAVHEVLKSLLIEDRHCPHAEKCLVKDAVLC